MVQFGFRVINRILIYFTYILNVIHVGEANTYYNADKYSCSFAKMIQYWRQIWNERTNGITTHSISIWFLSSKFYSKLSKIH
jgi:hypothetical protein